MVIHRINLDIIPGGSRPELWLNQYDDDFLLRINLFARTGEFTVESGTTAAIRGTKPDGHGFSAAATLNENTAVVTGNQQMTAAAGRCVYELTLYKDGKELNTANFIVHVERAALDRDTIPSASVIRELLDVTDQAEEIIAAGSDSEAYAIGTRGGVDVEPNDPAYHNNSKYYAENISANIKGIVEPSYTIEGLLSGGTPHEIQINNWSYTVVYEVKPSTAYRMQTEDVRLRFFIGMFDDPPMEGDVATWFEKHEEEKVDTTFTTQSTTHYVAAWYWISTDAADNSAGRFAVLDRIKLFETGSISVGEAFNNAFKDISVNSRKLDFIKTIDTLEPVYFIDGLLNGAGNHEIQSDAHSKIAVYVTTPYMTYKIKVSDTKPRLSVGIFESKPDVGSVPIYFAGHHTEHEFSIPGNNHSFYIAIWYYSDWFDNDTYGNKIKSLTVTGEKTTTLDSALRHINNSLDDCVQKKPDNEFTICTWNIGHFSGGVHTDTDITDSDYDTKLKAFYSFLQSVKPDVIAIEEYSRIFAALQRENVPTKEALFHDYKDSYIGEQRHYSCTGFYSNLGVRNVELKEYECLDGETISHTTLIEAQDYYYVQWDMVFCGVDIHCISTHCAFDTNRPDILQQKQYEELIDVCDDYDHVIIAGDFNSYDPSTSFDVFKTAGYDMVCNATPNIPFVQGVDNIITKGLTLIQKSRINTALSDHNMFLGRVRIS